jgi:ribosomal protein S14
VKKTREQAGKKPYIITCSRCGKKLNASSRRLRLCGSCWRESLPKGKGRKNYARLNKNRPEVFKRDSYRCQCCGDYKKLTIHHLDCDFRNNDMNNLITLCDQCHHSLHKKFSEKQMKNDSIYDLFPFKIKWGRFGKRLIYHKEQEVYCERNFPKRPERFLH